MFVSIFVFFFSFCLLVNFVGSRINFIVSIRDLVNVKKEPSDSDEMPLHSLLLKFIIAFVLPLKKLFIILSCWLFVPTVDPPKKKMVAGAGCNNISKGAWFVIVFFFAACVIEKRKKNGSGSVIVC